MRTLTKLFFGSIVGGAGYLIWQRYRNDLLARDRDADIGDRQFGDEFEGATRATGEVTTRSGIVEPEPLSPVTGERVDLEGVTAANPDLRDLGQPGKNIP